jgi:hypothetical protein
MSVELPDNAEDWPFEAKHTALSEVNTCQEIREEIRSIVGPEQIRDRTDGRTASQFTRKEMAAILLALGGPQGEA